MEYKYKDGFSKEELISMGINYDNMSMPFGEMNIIVQSFPIEKDGRVTFPEIYMPRKNRTYESDGINVSDETERKDFVIHLRDSVERLRVLAFLLERQANDIEEKGYTDVCAYYPEEKR